MATGATQAALPGNDKIAARTIDGERDGGLHHTGLTGTWHVWNGKAHPPDHSGEMDRVTLDFSNRLDQMLEAAKGWVLSDADRRTPTDASESARNKARTDAWAPWLACEKYAARLRSEAGQAGLTGLLKRTCGCTEDVMDAGNRTSGLLNFDNCTVNLASLVPQPHRKSDLITYSLPYRWNPQADCPRFRKMALRMLGGNYEVYCYFLKCLGYSLLGDNREQKIFFISGPTGSGKSQLLHIVAQVLGPLAHNSDADLITVVRHGRNARTENSIRGKRFLTITETSKWMSIDEAQLKRLTGEPVVSVNRHYATEELRTWSTWTIWVATNAMPTLVNFDPAMRRRIIVFPGGPTVPAGEMDPHLASSILHSEREGILALLAMGCREYFRTGGLEMPLDVQAATEQYAAEQNTVGDFVADTMVTGGYPGYVPQQEAWRAYEQWSKGSARLHKIEFMDQLGRYPGIVRNKISRRYDGVSWNADWNAKV